MNVSLDPISNKALTLAVDKFIVEYGHLWATLMSGTVRYIGKGVKDGSDVRFGIIVETTCEHDFLKAIPNKYMGFDVFKLIYQSPEGFVL